MLLPTLVFDIHMIGPHISTLVDDEVLRPRSSVSVTLHRGLYHVVQSHLSVPDIVIGKHLMPLSLLLHRFLCVFFVL